MSIVYMSGIPVDDGNEQRGMFDALRNGSSGTLDYSASVTRTGKYSAYITQDNNSADGLSFRAFVDDKTELFVQFSLYIPDSLGPTSALSKNRLTFLEVLDETCEVTQLMFTVNRFTRIIAVYLLNQTAGNLVAASTVSLKANRWHDIAIRIVVHATTGVLQVKLDNTLVIDESNINTIASGGGSAIGAVDFGSPTVSCGCDATTIYFDDIVINDTAGGVHDTWMGKFWIEEIHPTGDSTPSAWTPTGGGAHYTQVDDSSVSGQKSDGDTTKISSSTSAQADRYSMGSISVSNVTIAALNFIASAKQSSGFASFTPKVTNGGAATDSFTSMVPPIDYSYLNEYLQSLSAQDVVDYAEVEVD